MAQWHRSPSLWLALILAAVVVVAVVLWVRGAHTDSARSPLPTPAAREASPLSTPTPGNTMSPPPSSWTDGGAILLWVALGLLLALGIAIVILRWYRHTAR